ncbi:MAG: cupredoxin domain-containing protein [Gemmatimonadales bacterium]
MTGADGFVIVAGLAAIAWVNWYFFFARGPEIAAGAGGTGVQQITIEVEGGYTPALVRVQAGRPVRLDFHRRETSGCTEEVVIPDFGIRTFLPPHRITPVEFTPVKPGSHEFTCGMGMVRGRVIVEGESVKERSVKGEG